MSYFTKRPLMLHSNPRKHILEKMFGIKLFVFLAVLSGVVLSGTMAYFLYVLLPPPTGKTESEWVYNLAQIVVLFLGVLAGSIAAAISYRNQRMREEEIRLQEDGKFTDRFSHAIDQLGSENIAIRIGGIYALDRLANDSVMDRTRIVDVLCHHVHEQYSLPLVKISYGDEEPCTPDYSESRKLPGDLDAILNVLGRLASNFDDVKPNLSDVSFLHFDLTGKQLSRFNLRRASLYCALLTEADLTNTDLRSANLVGAILEEADLTAANLESANLYFADLLNAEIAGANLAMADYGENILDAHYDEHTVFANGKTGTPDISLNIQEAAVSTSS